MEIRVLLADDHSMVREGLRMFLERDPEIRVVADADNGSEAILLTRQLHPDVILMDILMPVMDGISATVTIRHEAPETDVIILSNMLERELVVQAVKAGATGYLLKDIQEAELCRVVKEVAAGHVQFPDQIAAYLMHEVQDPERSHFLTEREADVLRLLAKGLSNKDIAHHLHVVEDTVKSHVRHILSKLGVQSRTQAVLYAMHRGWVSP